MTPTQTNYDSEFCGKIPLHLINFIQSHGALLVLDPVNYTIVQCSQNTAEIIGTEPQNILGRNILDLLSDHSQDNFRRLLQMIPGSDKLPDMLYFPADGSGKTAQVLLHQTPEYLLLEIEPVRMSAQPATFRTLYQELKKSMATVSTAATMQEACLSALKELKKLTGFDRLMMYQFDEEWNGTVVAEVHEPGMDPYLNLRFPASDIPKISRELYKTNPYRHIPNRDYKPVQLTPVINSITGTFTDLSPCNLRGVAGVHIEYLQNMGVTASMSTRILAQGKLWGLISCHHRTAKHLSYEELAVFELISGMLSTKVVALERERDAESYTRLQKVQVKLIERVLLEGNISEALLREEGCLEALLGARGVAIKSNKRLYTQGTVPDNLFIEDLILWLQLNHNTEVVSFHRLGDVYEPANDSPDKSSGIIVIPIRPEQGEYIIGFRPEHVQEVSWGGNPQEAIQFEADGQKYHPRSSFKIWKQTVRGTSRKWSDPEMNMAARLRNFLQEFLLREYSRKVEL